MSLLKLIFGVSSCEICGTPLKKVRANVILNGQSKTVCANCKNALEKEVSRQAISKLKKGENSQTISGKASPQIGSCTGCLVIIIAMIAFSLFTDSFKTQPSSTPKVSDDNKQPPSQAAKLPANISIGASAENVKTNFGKPTQINNAGANEIWKYPDKSLIFKDGKVIGITH